MINRDFKVDFPNLDIDSNGRKLVYLDNAATTHKPKCVIEAIKEYYETSNANPHRGAYELSVNSTLAYDNARSKVKEFIGAKENCEIIFTKNATEALNLLGYSYGMNFIEKDDEIVISILEHHSNLLPWQKVSRVKNAKLRYIYLNDEERVSLEHAKSKITNKTKLVSITHVSNALGNINPIKEIIECAHAVGAKVILDASQSIPHMKVDVRELDVDFLVFSGHKIFAPMGIGVLYGKKELLEAMPPFILGGDMVEYVYEQEVTFNELPYKFEGGTQNVEGAIGLSKAIEYIENIGIEKIERKEKELLEYALSELNKLDFVIIYGDKNIHRKCGVISFNIKGVHPHDVTSILDSMGIAIRAGNHCAQPLMRYMNINSTCRVSISFYNTKEDIDVLIQALKKTYRIFLKWR